MYEIKNISYKIQSRYILKNISLSIKNNSFLAIVGPNGCGKSTLFKAINGAITSYEGKILLDSKNIKDYSDYELALKRSVLNQSSTFPYNFTAKEIIEMGLYSHNVSLNKKNEVMDYIIHKLDISDLENRNYLNLSGGEQQKVQLARVVTQLYVSKQKEKYLFLDEPTLNLDIYYQYKILELTKELIKDFNIGVCAILHDLNQAFEYSDEIIMIRDGEIIYQGETKKELNYHSILDIFTVQSDLIYSNKMKKKILITAINTN